MVSRLGLPYQSRANLVVENTAVTIRQTAAYQRKLVSIGGYLQLDGTCVELVFRYDIYLSTPKPKRPCRHLVGSVLGKVQRRLMPFHKISQYHKCWLRAPGAP